MNSIRLFERDATNFTTNGIANLTKDAINPKVTEEINGEFILEMEYPVTGIHYDEIYNDRIIVSKSSPYGTPQAFRIYQISLPMNGQVSIVANHISYDLSKIVLKAPPLPQASTPDVPGSFNGVQAAMRWINSANTLPAISNFTFSTTLTDTARLDMPIPMSVKAFLGGDADNSLLNMYGGEFIFDNFDVRLVKSRGEDKGVAIRYGKNMTDMTQDEDYSKIFTGVYPYYQSNQDGFIDGAVQYVLNEQGQKAYSYDYIGILDCSSVDWTAEGYHNHTDDQGKQEWIGMPTRAMLETYAKKYLEESDPSIPSMNLSVSFIELSKMSGFEGLESFEKVSLGDIVKIVYPTMTATIKSECIKTVYDAKTDMFESIELGDTLAMLSDSMSSALSVSSNASNKIDRSISVINENNQSIIALQNEIEILKTRLTDVEQDCASLDSRVDSTESDITSIGDRVTTAESDITSIGDRVANAEGNIIDKVDKTAVIASINASTETELIARSKIEPEPDPEQGGEN